MNFELVVDELKGAKLAELFQVNNYVDSLIKIQNSAHKIDADGFPKCPHCGNEIVKKNGKMPNGTQRYLCLNDKCKKSFSSNTNSFSYRLRKLKDYLYLMIEYTLDGLSIRNISKKLNIPINTVWMWRTKILLSLETFIDKENPLTDVVYSDETFIKINLKGTKNHKMPRVSYYEGRPAIAHRELVCIQTVIDDSKRTIFDINGVARLSKERLDLFLTPFINEETIIVSDGDYSYVGFAEKYLLQHERIINMYEKSKNGYSLGPINNLHSSFKSFMKKYKGVSTRRLNGYINLFILDNYLNQILNGYEKVEYIYESLLALENNPTFEEIFNVKFPIDVKAIYDSLRKDGYIMQ
ncbi:MAG: IS1595 family transposase [Acholeplasmataceae bacterium]|jgi:transposase-like protein